jgi:glucosamine 6-phosphate synthetase-like amidotransferase/phosphosugar isomerase protein
MAGLLEKIDGPIAEIAASEATRTMFLFSGGGPNWATAVVGAAKVKECTPNHAVAIQVEEYHHYNSQKVGEPLWIFAPSGPSVPRAIETGTDAHRWGGQLFVVTTEGETAFDALADRVLFVPNVHESLSALLYLVPAQLVGYHLGMAMFALAEETVNE